MISWFLRKLGLEQKIARKLKKLEAENTLSAEQRKKRNQLAEFLRNCK